MRAGEDSCPTRITLRGGLEVEDPLESVLRFLEMYPRSQSTPASSATSFDESDLRLANRGGARISATQAAAILDRRHVIEGVLRMIPPRASLMSASVRWMQLTRLFQGFAEIHGVGFSKMTKSLHPKRPALIPMLDSVVQQYLADSRQAHDSFAEQAIELVRRYKADADRNRVALAELRQELAGRGYGLTEVRILDILIWSTAATSW